MVEPEGPNVIKLERFIFDIVPRAERSAILRTERSHEFAPIKNATGPDSLETSQQIQSDLYGGWLRQHGVQVPQDDAGRTTVRIEIEPLTAMRPGDLAGSDLPAAIEPGGSLLL